MISSDAFINPQTRRGIRRAPRSDWLSLECPVVGLPICLHDVFIIMTPTFFLPKNVLHLQLLVIIYYCLFSLVLFLLSLIFVVKYDGVRKFFLKIVCIMQPRLFLAFFFQSTFNIRGKSYVTLPVSALLCRSLMLLSLAFFALFNVSTLYDFQVDRRGFQQYTRQTDMYETLRWHSLRVWL